MFYFVYVLYLVFSCLGMILMKIGGEDTQISLLHSELSLKVDIRLLIGLCSYVLSFILFTWILQKKDLSILYPTSAGIINVITVVLGVCLFKEKITVTSAIGVIGVIIGVILMNIRG